MKTNLAELMSNMGFDVKPNTIEELADLIAQRLAPVFAKQEPVQPQPQGTITGAKPIPSKGDRVRVVRGRKVPIGTEGVLFWEQFDSRFDAYRIGIRDDSKEVHWTYKKNVETIPFLESDIPF